MSDAPRVSTQSSAQPNPDPLSVDVLAAQVRNGLGWSDKSRVNAEAEEALGVLVGYAKRAEELEASLRDAHDFYCGCDAPGKLSVCVAAEAFGG